MAFVTSKRKSGGATKEHGPRKKKFKIQKDYSSGSSDGSDRDDELIARDAPKRNGTTKPSLRNQKTAFRSFNEQKSQGPGPVGSSETKATIHGVANQEDGELDEHPDQGQAPVSEDEVTDASNSDSASAQLSDSDEDATTRVSGGKKTKRHDPSAFANSLTAILSSKLPTSKRVDPVLSRSKDAKTANHELVEGRLESMAKRKMREEKKLASEKGRVKDVLLGDRSDPITLPATIAIAATETSPTTAAEIAEQERRLRKTAQRGVVKLFNAVRAAQVKGEEEAKAARERGVVGSKQREERVGEMGRKAFLDLVGGGGNS